MKVKALLPSCERSSSFNLTYTDAAFKTRKKKTVIRNPR